MNFGMLKLLTFLLATVVMTSCKDDDVNNEATLSAGNYTGLWNSTTGSQTFANLSISAKITEAGSGQFQGSFYISKNFTSCCGGANDGTISFTISDKDIKSFAWDDTIIGCTGAFSGAGTITGKDAFRIEFTGKDCDGDHTGHLTLSK